jgi:uncharacterized protein (TIGR02466 family)
VETDAAPPNSDIPAEYVGGLFPIPLGHYRRDIPLQEEEGNAFLNAEWRQNMGSPNMVSKDDHVLQHPDLQFLKDWIDISIEKFVATVHSVNESQLQITQSWMNKTTRATHHSSHYHSNSMYSGVFYPWGNESSPLVFQARDKGRLPLVYTDECNRLEQQPIIVGPMTLLLFPSYLSHGVPPLEHNTDRYSLSFNTWLKPGAQLGLQESSNYLTT